MTIIIILITCVISFSAFTNSSIIEKYKFNPYKINRNGEYLRFLSHGFLHTDMMHLGFNMMTLFFVGNSVESEFKSSFVFLLFYLSALFISSIFEYFKQKNNPYYSALGASGAVSACLFSLLMISPWGKVYVFFSLPIPFIIFAVLYLYYSYYMSKRQLDNIGHIAHISGAIYGIIFSIIWNPSVITIFFNELLNPPTFKEFLKM